MIDPLGQFLESLWFGEDNICEYLVSGDVLQIAFAKAFHQSLIIGTTNQRAPTNNRQVPPSCYLNGHCKARESSVTFVLHRASCLGRSGMRHAAIRITKSDVFRGTLKCFADRVVV